MEGMSSRELVARAFEHEAIDRVPCWCGASPDFLAKAEATLGLDEEGFRRRIGDDFRRVTAPWRDPGPPLASGSTWRSPFGVERHGIGYGQPTSHPLAAFVAEGVDHTMRMKAFREWNWPSVEDIDVGGLRARAMVWGGQFALLGGDWSPFWHDVIDLVSMEGLYYLMYDDPEATTWLFDRVTDFYLASSERIFEEAGDLIDVFFIGNDFGSTNGPLFGPELYERFISPSIRKYADLGHRHGLKVMLHCCGGYLPLIPLMIRDGLDGLHALQPLCAGMDPAGLKRDFGSLVLLNGAIDTQTVLLEGTPALAREATLRTIALMSPGGGYVAGPSHDWLLGETPLENVLALYDAIREWNEGGRR
ncbi:MAG TPA: uroporphyrinogen decarboxylase family protein [Rectinemataceae bacterium]|nr:uroporphyrinogen decarboxylase family protein [Rectinemataceae bacterium]